jgi:hypothetical protein
MKFLASKSVAKKLIIAIVLILLVNFTLAPHQVQAGIPEEAANILLDIVRTIGDRNNVATTKVDLWRRRNSY